MKLNRILATASALVAVLAANNIQPVPAAEPVTLTALVASSARPPFDALVAQFEKKNPGVKITAQYLGGGQVVSKIDGGDTPDIVLVGETPIKRVSGVVEPLTPIYKTIDVVITSKKNSAGVHELKDLAKPGVKVAMGTPASAVGAISSQIIQKAAIDYGFDFVQKVLKNANVQSEKGQDVVDAVASGKSDAAIVFVTDGDTTKFNVIEIPEKYNVISTYVGTVSKKAKNAKLGHEFVALMASKEGQSVFRKMRYLPPT
jgi:molybdate transport system substrate-binding protein